MVNYQNGKIYKIICNTTGLVYYGSTVRTLKIRLNGHINENDKRNCSSKLVLKNNNFEISLVENYPCNTKKELHNREGYYQRNNDCVNKNIAGRTLKEYRIDNREKIKEQSKQYTFINKDKIKEYQKKYNLENNEKIKERTKQYTFINKDKIKEYQKKYHLENNEKIKEQKKQYRQNNKEKIAVEKRKYYDKNIEKVKEMDKNRSKFKNTWCGNYHHNNHNNLLRINVDLFN